MPFAFSQLPLYKPRPQQESEVPPENGKFEIVRKPNGTLSAVFTKDYYHPKFDIYLMNREVGEVIGECQYGKFTFSYSPLGLKHLFIDAKDFRPDSLSYYRDELLITSISVTSEALTFPGELQGLGFLPRTPFTRWFSPVAKDAETLSASWRKNRRKALAKHLAHSERVIVRVESLTNENFKDFARIYRKSMEEKRGGMEIFYVKMYEEKGVPPGFKGIFFYHPDTRELIGVSIINTWGAIGDTAKEPRKYCSCQGGAFAQESKEFHIGYRDFLEEMKISNSLGDSVYSAGSDFNFYGADLACGLYQNKTVAGFYNFPEGKLEWFKILRERDIYEKSDEKSFCFLSLRLESEYSKKFVNVTNPPLPDYTKFFNEDLYDPKKMWVLEYYGEKEKWFSSPDGIEVRWHKIG